MELNYAANPAGVRRCAGLSFKSGYQQTGYAHTIGSYRMCQVLLLLGAWSLELGQERRILCPSPAAVIGFS